MFHIFEKKNIYQKCDILQCKMVRFVIIIILLGLMEIDLYNKFIVTIQWVYVVLK